MKIGLAQCNFTVGDFAGNAAQILEIYEANADHTDLVVFSELALSGYYPMDLIERPGFIEQQDRQLARLALATRGRSAALLLGCIERNQSGQGKPLHNALVVYANGDTIFRYRKQLLPTYNIFDEARHFEPGPSGGQMFSWCGQRIACLICEDGWYNRHDPLYRSDPVTELAASKMDVIVSINASPGNLGKHRQRLAQIAGIARRCGKPLVYVNQVGGNDEVVYDGQSFVLDGKGQPILQMKGFALDFAVWDSCVRNSPFTPPGNIDDDACLYQLIQLGLRDYFRKCGFEKTVVGCSGGIDSAVTLALAKDALGADRVIAIAMPGPYSSVHSLRDAAQLCDRLGVRLYRAPIVEAYAQAIKDFQTAFSETPSTLTRENLQARLRGQTLMAFSNHFGHLLLSTGNKSEMSVGYATLYGDMNGGLNLIGDCYKMEVYGLARYYNRLHGREIIPNHILDKEPSAELAPYQKDSDTLPPYPVLDAILRLYIEDDLLTDDERRRAVEQLEGAPTSTIESIFEKIDRAEFKRHQAPPIIRVHARAFGMGRRMPIAHRHQVRYEDVEVGKSDGIGS